MIDRNLKISYLIVDEMHNEHPDLVRDQYWDDVFPTFVPFASRTSDGLPPKHSTYKMDIDPPDLRERKSMKLSLLVSTIVFLLFL